VCDEEDEEKQFEQFAITQSNALEPHFSLDVLHQHPQFERFQENQKLQNLSQTRFSCLPVAAFSSELTQDEKNER
jgi:hypothetical protein